MSGRRGEINPSIDTLIEMLRDQGLRIGVVVDEAHHGFGQETHPLGDGIDHPP